jgi:hypothetical protein
MTLHPVLSAGIAAFLTVMGAIQVSNGAYGWAAASFIVAIASAFSAYRGWKLRRG